MREFRFDKLVRDKIAVSIIDGGGKVNSKILNDQELLSEAKKKLLEETRELSDADDDKIVEELSDIQELVDLICDLKGLTKVDLARIKTDKAQQTGAFKQRIFVETVEIPDNSKWIDYYLSQPDRYPEVK